MLKRFMPGQPKVHGHDYNPNPEPVNSKSSETEFKTNKELKVAVQQKKMLYAQAEKLESRADQQGKNIEYYGSEIKQNKIERQEVQQQIDAVSAREARKAKLEASLRKVEQAQKNQSK